MKILRINKYHYIRGGSDSVYFNTGLLLKRYGHEIIDFAMEFEENEPSDQRSYFAKNNDYVDKNFAQKIADINDFFYNSDAASRLDRLLELEKPDIAHLHIFYGSLTSSILSVLRKRKIPAVVSVHDYKFVCPSYLFLDGKNQICELCQGRNYYHSILKKCIKGSVLYSSVFALESYFRDTFFPIEEMFSRLIFVSKFSSNIHQRFKPEFKNISTHLYNFDPTLAKNLPLDLSKSNSYFIYAGRLSREKGVQTLLDSFRLFPNLSLKIVGTGPELDSLRENAPENVDFVGFKRGDELKSLIRGSSYVIVPSEWYENNPMAIIEAYTFGKPVIGARIGGIPEIVIENETGYLFEPGSIIELCNIIDKVSQFSQIRYNLLATSARTFSEKHFHPDIHYVKLMEIYNEAIGHVASENSNKNLQN